MLGSPPRCFAGQIASSPKFTYAVSKNCEQRRWAKTVGKDGGQRRWAMAAGKFDLLRHRHHFITHDPNTALGAMLLECGYPSSIVSSRVTSSTSEPKHGEIGQ